MPALEIAVFRVVSLFFYGAARAFDALIIANGRNRDL
jgi:hypothetical protein